MSRSIFAPWFGLVIGLGLSPAVRGAAPDRGPGAAEAGLRSAEPRSAAAGGWLAARAKPKGEKAGTTAPAGPVAVVDSLALLERAVASDSSRFDVLSRLGVFYIERDRYAEAIQVLERARRENPEDIRVLVNLGAAHDGAAKPDLAQQFYRDALRLSPDDSLATCRLASSLYATERYAEAVDLLRGLIASKPGSHCAYFTLGVAFADAGIFRDAIRMWKKVVELAPNSPEGVSASESIVVLEKFVQAK